MFQQPELTDRERLGRSRFLFHFVLFLCMGGFRNLVYNILNLRGLLHPDDIIEYTVGLLNVEFRTEIWDRVTDLSKDLSKQ